MYSFFSCIIYILLKKKTSYLDRINPDFVIEQVIKQERKVVENSSKKISVVDDNNNDDWNDDYGSHYGKYAGTYAQDIAGFSDDVIDDAFEGDPDAYWNID